MLVTFFDVYAGAAGLIGVLTANLAAYWLGFSRKIIRSGLYGFNALLVCLGLGIYFQPNAQLLLMLILAAVLTLFISVALQGILGKYYLPYLSVPFLFGIWTVMVAAIGFQALGISERGVYTLNELYTLGGERLVALYEWWNTVAIPASLKTYFISLGAIFFQYNVLSGVLISLGLLVFSRIAFSLSLLGFYTAFFFYQLIGAELSTLNYSYIGFNYILTAIAIGGFFVVPGRLSYFWVVVLIPLVALLSTALAGIFSNLRLPVYSLPFNVMVLMFLYALRLREKKSPNLTLVEWQENMPERNLYLHQNTRRRFGEAWRFPFKLPFWGVWTVQQGHNGQYTHKEHWKHAWDFVITGSNGKTYQGDGSRLTDYFCYEKAVLAPAEGIVAKIADDIPDNPIGEANLKQNWGNTIVIKHLDGLFSKLSHLKAESIKVKEGEHIMPGQMLALCGNSGRSPEPHLHFQIQATPFIGSQTLDYPVAHYLLHENERVSHHSFSRPTLDQKVSNVQIQTLIDQALKQIPGREMQFEVLDKHGKTIEKAHFEIQTDAYNNSFWVDKKSHATAQIYNDGTVHYFKLFRGSRKSHLYMFFLALFKVQLGFQKDMKLTDEFPTNHIFRGLLLSLQDFFAPFFSFLKGKFEIRYLHLDDDFSGTKARLQSKTEIKVLGKTTKKYTFDIEIDEKGLEKMTAQNGKKQLVFKRLKP